MTEAQEEVVAEFRGVQVRVYPSTTQADTISVQIETDGVKEGQRIRVMLNDADLYVGDPNTDQHPWAAQVQEFYDMEVQG